MSTQKYKTILDRLAEDIRQRKYQPGARLVTHRKFASQEKIALSTASKIYQELAKMGLVSCEVGRGTFVKESQVPPSHGIKQASLAEGMLDLNFNSPILENQPKMLRDALRKLSYSGDLASLLSYQPHNGRLNDKSVIKNYLAHHNISAETQNMAIVNGAQQGLALTVMSLLKPGDLIAVDAITYPGFKLLAQVHGLELIAIPMLNQCTDLNALTQACEQRKIKAIYSMPTLHNPLGSVMGLAQRKQLIEIARKHQLTIIEDAAYSFLETQAPPALVTLAPDITFYISGFSKSLATGLRVGFILSPTKWVSSIERSIRATTWNTAGLLSALTCQWIEDGSIYHLEQEKRLDAIKRQEIVKKVFHELSYQSHPASYFLWLPLPEDVRSDLLIKALLDLNISVSNAEPYATTEHIPQAVRLALASVEISKLESTLTLIKETIEFQALGM
jgi:DNA-binding transcriptional MocR family regulator